MASHLQCVAVEKQLLVPGLKTASRRVQCRAFGTSHCRVTRDVLRAPTCRARPANAECDGAPSTTGKPTARPQTQFKWNSRWLAGFLPPAVAFWALPGQAMEMAEEVLSTNADDLDTSSVVLLLMMVVAVRFAIQNAAKEEDEQDPPSSSDSGWQDMSRANVRTVVDPRTQQPGSPNRPILSMYDMEKSAMATASARSVAGSVREARRQIAALKIEQKLRPGLLNDGRQLTGYPGAEYLSMMIDGYLGSSKSNLSRQLLVQQLSDQALGQCVLRMVAEIAALDQVKCLMQSARKTEKQSHNWVRTAV